MLARKYEFVNFCGKPSDTLPFDGITFRNSCAEFFFITKSKSSISNVKRARLRFLYLSFKREQKKTFDTTKENILLKLQRHNKLFIH